eukprot:Opistho-1_new@53223
MIMSILCSIRQTVRPCATILRISAARPTVSSGFTPPAGSSSSTSLGSVASARAKATRLRSSCVMSPAMRCSRCARPTKSSAARAFSRQTRSSCCRRFEPVSTSHRPERVRRRWPTIRLSSTVAMSNRVVVWKVRATPRRATSSVRSGTMSRPSNVMLPLVGLMTPPIRLKKVVLPAPFGPMMALILPRSIVVLTSFTAALPPKRLVRFLISSTAHLRLGLNRGRLGDRLRRHRLPARAPAHPAADDAVRHEDDQQDQQRPEDQEAVLLQELHVLGQPGHHQRAQQRPQQGAQAADQHVPCTLR